MIHLECPGCSATFSVADASAGKTGKCPKCGTQFAIPAADSPSGPSGAVGQESVEVRPCPGCQARIAVARGDLGSTVECPYCVTRFLAEPAERVPPPPREPRSSRRTQPARVSRRRDETDDDLDDEDYDDRPRRRRSRRSARPSNISTIGVLLLIGGIYSFIYVGGGLLGSFGICCLWPGVYLQVVWGILAIIRGSAMMNGRDANPSPPTVLLALQILLALNFDVINMVLGIVGLVMANQDDIKEYYAGN